MVNVVIVTYGNRWRFLEQVVVSLKLIREVNKIIIVNNKSEYKLDEKFINFDNQIVLINLKENSGSAGGFKIGLTYVMENFKQGFVWLLDDDNLPTPNTLNILLNGFENKRKTRGNNMFALMCLRPDRSYLQKIANGESVSRILPIKNSFFGFNLFNLPNQIIGKLKLKQKPSNHEFISLPFAPYGGLFFPTEILDYIGLPDERYYLYADDFEFTNRITKAGGNIYLIPQAKVDDLEKSWITQKQNLLRSRMLDQNNFKAYLSARNSTHFQSHNRVSNRLMFNINKIIYLLYLFIVSIVSFKIRQFKLIVIAVKEGERGIFDNEKYIKQSN